MGSLDSEIVKTLSIYFVYILLPFITFHVKNFSIIFNEICSNIVSNDLASILNQSFTGIVTVFSLEHSLRREGNGCG